MLARLKSDVIDEKPTLVIWQLGTNAVICAIIRSAKIDPASSTKALRRSRVPGPMSSWSIRNSCRA